MEGNIGAGHNSVLRTLNALVPGERADRHLNETGFDARGQGCAPEILKDDRAARWTGKASDRSLDFKAC